MGEKIPKGWKKVKLGEVAELSKNSWKVGDEKLPYIGLEHIEENKLRLNSIRTSNEVTSNKFIFTENEFLFGKLRPYFRKLYRPKFKGICSTDIWVVKPKNNVNKDFLFYLFANQEFVDLANKGASGTKMPRADWKFMQETEWLIPEKEAEQKAIASVLSSLDDKIDLLHRQNKTLEQMAETLFRQWFIKPSPNLSQRERNSSEEAKEDWDEGVLPDEFDFTMGQSPPGDSYNEEKIGVPLFQGNADFGFRFPNNRIYTTAPKRFAEKYDTLISVRAPVGEQNMAFEKCCIGRGVVAFRYKYNKSFYTYTYFKLKSLMKEIKQYNETGTVFGSITKSDFQTLEITIPPKELVEEFQKIAKLIDDKIIKNCIQIRTLEQLRDTLLPKLMSGEVRVRF